MKRLTILLCLICAAPASAAPVLTASGETLKWTAVEGATRYRTQINPPWSIYRTDSCCESKPTITPPAEVKYQVQEWEPVVGAWSNEVTIKYPVEGEVVFRGDGSEPLYEQWASMSAGTSGGEWCGVNTTSTNLPNARIGYGANSLFPKGTAIHDYLQPGDNCFSTRTELKTAERTGFTKGLYHNGDDVWAAYGFVYDSNVPVNNHSICPRNAGTIIQFHDAGGTGAATAALALGTNSGEKVGFTLWGEYFSSKFFTPTSGELKPLTLYRLVMHVLFEETATGTVEAFVGVGSETPQLYEKLTSVQTINPAAVPIHIQLGLYRDTLCTSTPEQDWWDGGFSIATTRATAEAAAF